MGKFNLLQYPISIFLDSNIFIAKKYDFSSMGIFNTLTNFVQEGKVKIYISHIVEYEVKKHIKDNVNEMLVKLDQAINGFSKKVSNNLINECKNLSVLENLESEKLIEEYIGFFENFIFKNDVIILNSDNIDCNKIISDYFNNVAPFEANSKKKHEFPDAFIVAKLKKVFNDKNPVHIISSDEGFCKSFECNNSFHIHKSLEEVLDLINKDQEQYEQISKKLACFNADLLYKEFNNGMHINNFLYVATVPKVSLDLHYLTSYIYNIENLNIKSFLINEILSDSDISVSFKCSAQFFIVSDYDEIVEDMCGEIHKIDEICVYEMHETTFECEVKLSYPAISEQLKVLSYSTNINLNNSTLIGTQKIMKKSAEEDYLGEMYDTVEDYYNH